MRRIYISFLGAGDYTPAVYHIENKQADRSQYVQFAELQLTGVDYFDKIFLVMTKTSKEKQYSIRQFFQSFHYERHSFVV